MSGRARAVIRRRAALGAVLTVAAVALAPAPLRAQAEPAVCKDTTITGIVRTRLAADKEIGQFRIGIVTSDCVVTLSGCVESKDQVKKAKELAKRMVHVKVKNDLTVCTIAPRIAPPKKSKNARTPQAH